MSLLGGIGGILGVGPDPGADALNAFAGANAANAAELRKFRPFRVTSELGTQSIDQTDGVTQLQIDSPELTAAVARFEQAQTGGASLSAQARNQGKLPRPISYQTGRQRRA